MRSGYPDLNVFACFTPRRSTDYECPPSSGIGTVDSRAIEAGLRAIETAIRGILHAHIVMGRSRFHRGYLLVNYGRGAAGDAHHQHEEAKAVRASPRAPSGQVFT